MDLRRWLGRLRSSSWSGWPEKAYRRERYRQRLLAVQKHLAECLDLVPAGSVRIVSVCAGDGRDVIGVLKSHPRGDDVSAWLVELDPRSVATGARKAASAGLGDAVRFLNADATAYATYKDAAPSEIVLLCGVWGHVPVQDRPQVVHALAALCRPGGLVIWTLGVSKGAVRLQEIQSLFGASTWDLVRLSFTSDENWAVATYRYGGPPRDLPESGRIFHFQVGSGTRGR